MPKQYSYTSLKKATIVRRAHDKNTPAPGMRLIENLYIQRSTLLPCLRPDLEPIALPACASDGATDDFLNASAYARATDLSIYFTKYEAQIPTGFDCISLACPPTPQDSDCNFGFRISGGRVVRVGGSPSYDILTAVWPGVTFSEGGVRYTITEIEADTGIITTDPPGGGFAAVDIKLAHDPDKAVWPMHLDDFFDELIYNSIRPKCGNIPSRIVGPFSSQVNSIGDRVPGNPVTATNWETTATIPNQGANLQAVYQSGIGYNVGTSGVNIRGLEATAPSPWGGSLLQQISDIHGFADNGTVMVAVGGFGGSSEVFRSADGGVTWTQEVAGGSTLLDVKWVTVNAINEFVAVGVGGTIITSPDGITWTPQVSGTANTLNYLNEGPTHISAVGDLGTALVSADALAWSAVTGISATANLAWVTQSQAGANWQAVGDDGAGAGYEASWAAAGGAAITAGALGTVPLNSVAYNSAQQVLLAVGFETVQILEELDAGVWRSDVEWRSPTYVAGVIVDFQIVPFAPGPVDEGDAVFEAFTQAGVTDNGSTQDGFVIASNNHSTFRKWNLVNRPQGGFYLEDFRDGTAFSQLIGGAVSHRSNATGFDFNGVEYLVVDSYGFAHLISPTGTVTASTQVHRFILRTALWDSGNSQWIVFGDVGEIFTSPDGLAWTPRVSGITDRISDAHTDGSLIVAVGENGAIITSPDGTTWTVRASGTGNDLLTVNRDFGVWVAAGLGGSLTTSPAGVTWTAQTLSGTLRDLSTNGTRMLALDTSTGDIFSSTDGLAWSSATPNVPVGQWLEFGNGKFASQFAASDDGLFWVETDASIYGPAPVIFTGSVFAILAGTIIVTNPAPWLLPATQDASGAYECFEALSPIHRGAAFAAVDGYVVIGGVLDWELDDLEPPAQFSTFFERQTWRLERTGDGSTDFGDFTLSSGTQLCDARLLVTEPVLDEDQLPTSEVLTERLLILDIDYEIPEGFGGTRVRLLGELEILPDGWKLYSENRRGPGQWCYYPRRIRWTVPGTVNDFEGVGSGFADLSGFGEILDARRVGHNLILFETDQVSLLHQTSSIDDPWEYQTIKEKHRIMSNPIAQDHVVYWIGDDGLIYYSDGLKVSAHHSLFDITEFEDILDEEPVWLMYSLNLDSLMVFIPGRRNLYLIEPDSGSVSSFLLPLYDDGVNPVMYPQSVNVVQDPCDGRVFVGYAPSVGDPESPMTLVFDLDDAVTGVDQFPDGVLDHWCATLETGEIPFEHGAKVRVQEMLFEAYSEAGDNPPDVAVETVSQEQNDWWASRDEYGTITVGPGGATGIDTAWARKIADGDGIADTFTTPGLVNQSRVFVNGVEQVLGVDYNQTNDYEIQFVIAPGAGQEIAAYWCGEPYLRVKEGDYFETSEGCHRIESIEDSTNATVSWAPLTPLSGTHLPARPILQESTPATGARANKSDEIYIGLNALVEDLKLRIRVIPRVNSTVRTTCLIGFTIVLKPEGQKLLIGDT